MKWKIWYGDGSTFSSEDGPPAAAPSANVQVIAQEDPDVGRFLLNQRDYYIFNGGEIGWSSADQAGFWDYMINAPNPKIIGIGRVISNAEFQAIYNSARNDPFLPPKSGFRPDEMRI